MYDKAGLSCKDIAPMFGVSESTVKRWMRAAGVIRSDAGRTGRPLSEECKNGHDLSKWRRRTPKGINYCLLCNRERGQRNWRKNHGQEDPPTEEA